MTLAPFHARLLAWFDQHGRHDLPWQHPRTPYRVWLSEVMLQQTQVAAVIPYFERFLARFPDLASLAAAPIDDVLRHWAGLGYYARARNLHRAAQVIVEQHGGEFPLDFEAVAALPGIGRSTAGAILAQAANQRHAILDGNVKRVLARWGAVPGWPGVPKVQAQLWAIAESLLPDDRFADYTQALMDLGASICTSRKPACQACPVSADCRALLEHRIPDFPSPKPKRHRPHRQGRLILIERPNNEWLLERRPPTGIWGGLYCPPIVMDGEDWKATLSRYHLQDGGDWLPTIHHTFTHFDLDLLPVRMPAPRTAKALAEPTDRTWIKLSAPEDWPALPSPLRKLFEGLARQGTLRLEPMTESSP